MSSESAALADIADLREEAGDARNLASMFNDGESVSDLLSYAAALDLDADLCEEAFCHPDANSGFTWSKAFIASASR